MNTISIAFQSGSILLREGLEAMLVIAALAAFLRKAGANEHLKWLYGGALVAIAASIGAAALLERYFGGMHDDRIEAVVMFVAAGLMLYMSGWLFLRQKPAAWTAELKQAADRAITRGTTISLAVLAFLSVFREGAEAVLFLHATARSTGGWGLGLMIGLVVAAAALVALFIVMQWLAYRLPLKPVFIATSAFLFVMGLRFIGLGIQECQEQVIVPVHSVSLPQWLIDVGLNPSWEAIGTQAVVGAIAVLSTLGLMRMRTSAA
jgi:high-affinity iron transporter